MKTTTKTATMPLGTVRATAIEVLHKAAGLQVEIEAGDVGLVVYGPSRATVTASARNLVTSARLRDPLAKVETVAEEKIDELPATRWYAVVAFDWNRIA